ncbi:hypothetical protein RJ55_03704 [Drechmeria coniospora]|nr:hypothetical protein RJ55_03704 [Drechmeria coniospora]
MTSQAISKFYPCDPTRFGLACNTHPLVLREYSRIVRCSPLPWTNQGQNAADEQNQWQSGFAFPTQNGQYDPSQHQWSPPMAGQAAAFAAVSHDAQNSLATDFRFDPTQQPVADTFLEDHLTTSQPTQMAFHAGSHSTLHQQFPDADSAMLDPSFGGSLHPTMFGQQQPQQPQQPQQQPQQQQQQVKLNMAGGNAGMGHMAMGQIQNNSHTHPQAFAQSDFAFPAGTQPFGSPANQVPQYSPPPLLARLAPARRQSLTPQQQQFDNNLRPNHAQASTFRRPTQQSPDRQRTQQQLFPAPGQPLVPPATAPPDQFQPGNHAHLGFQEFPDHASQAQLQQAHQASTFSSPQQLVFQQPVQLMQGVSGQQQQPTSNLHQQVTAANTQYMTQQEPETFALAAAEPSTKKRKRASKGAPDATATEPPAPAIVELSPEVVARKTEEIDALTAPVPTADEAKLLADAGKRGRNGGAKVAQNKAIPYLVGDGSIQLPAPKSFDKLAPLVAVPPRSGKPAVPGLGYALPCEVQGMFTSQYNPSSDRVGLDERREEAKGLLDEYDRSMTALGKRQPKYTEYPHAFKEQLKADEALKNKAGKKAKKEQEGERGAHKPIRPATRPTDPAAAAVWDITGIVHIEPSVGRNPALIANRVKEAGEYLINLRGEANRSKVAHDQATKDKLPTNEIAELKAAAAQKKQTLYKALDATVEHADDAVLDNLGGHQKLVLSLVNALISCIKSNDFSGDLPKIVLELFTLFKMTKKIAETPNLDMVLKRFEDKGDEAAGELAREVAQSMTKLIKATGSDAAPGYAGTSAAGRVKAKSGPGDGPSAKRGRDDDDDTRTVKKIAVEPGSSALSKKLGQFKAPMKAAASKATSSILPGKSRPVAKPASKPSPPAGADGTNASTDDKGKSDPKKGTKFDAKPGAAAPKKEVKAPPKPAASSSSSVVSSISSLLESINAKKPEIAAVTTKDSNRSETPETAEQRTKRLHKEARRRLRVSWKPESELVQIRIFEKDDEEDEGRASNMILDAADDRSEGMVLKRRADVGVEDEDDDPYQPWESPVATDLSTLPDDVRRKNFVTRGGHVAVATEEQKRIAEREQRELMAVYTDPADIPATPKSPPSEPSAAKAEVKVAQLPQDDDKFKEIHRRWQEEQQIGPDKALQEAMKRLDSKSNLSTRLDSILGRLHQAGSGKGGAAAQQPPGLAQAMEIATKATNTNVNIPFVMGNSVETHVLAWLKWDGNQAWRDPNPVHVDPTRVHQYGSSEVEQAGMAIEGLVKGLAGRAHPANSPPEWLMPDEERVREWWLGYNKELAAKQKKEEEARAKAGAEAEANALLAAAAAVAGQQGQVNLRDWSAYFAQQQQQQQAYAPYMALLQQLNGGARQAPAQQQPLATLQTSLPDSQLQSILAAINSQPSQQLQQAPTQSNPAGYELSHQYSQMGQDRQASSFEGGDRDRDWQDAHGRDDGPRDADEGRKKKRSGTHHKSGKAHTGSKLCTYWQQGSCVRGDKCTFRHD